VPAGALRQPPLPSQVPSRPQGACGDTKQSCGEPARVPAGNGVHVPTVPGPTQVMQIVAQREEQHTPSTQNELTQSAGTPHSAPAARGPGGGGVAASMPASGDGGRPAAPPAPRPPPPPVRPAAPLGTAPPAPDPPDAPAAPDVTATSPAGIKGWRPQAATINKVQSHVRVEIRPAPRPCTTC
jgi:hypothetical protein